MEASRYPNALLRRKLSVAGIPAAEHTVEALAAKIPDFNVHSLDGLSPDSMADLLLYLIAKGVVTLAVASEMALLDMPWGSHVCQFYTAKEDLLSMLVPYFKQGLERNEACVWLVGDLTVEEARAALAVAVPDLQRYLDKGQMQIRHYTELYTTPDGKVKPPAELSDAFAAMGSTVTASGYEGLRASGSVSWVKDEESMARFMEYETKVNLAIQTARIMAVCTYPAGSAAMCQCRELIHNHGRIFVQQGAWVHDRSTDARKVESIFTSLVAQSNRPDAQPRAAAGR